MITSVIKNGTMATVRDEHGKITCNYGCNREAELVGFTSNSWTLRIGRQYLVYDEHGRQISTYFS